MERHHETTSSGMYGYGEGRGAGGKFRKPPARKPHATPYDRPLSNQSRSDNESGGGWFSKPVGMARRLISGGATRILPYFFSKSPSTDVPATCYDQDHGVVSLLTPLSFISSEINGLGFHNRGLFGCVVYGILNLVPLLLFCTFGLYFVFGIVGLGIWYRVVMFNNEMGL